jgi:hypothetical protein
VTWLDWNGFAWEENRISKFVDIFRHQKPKQTGFLPVCWLSACVF